MRSFKGAWIDTMSDQRSSSSSGMAGLVERPSEMERSVGCGVFAALDVAVVVDALPQQGDGGTDRRFRHRMGGVADSVADLNPAFGGGFQIDVVHTGSGDADQFELRQHLDSFGPQGDLVGDDDVCVDTTLGYFTGRRFFVAGIISQLLDAGEVDSSQAVLI